MKTRIYAAPAVKGLSGDNLNQIILRVKDYLAILIYVIFHCSESGACSLQITVRVAYILIFKFQ